MNTKKQAETLSAATQKTIIRKGREGWEGDTTITNSAGDWGVKITTSKGYNGEINSRYQFCEFKNENDYSSFTFEMFGSNPRFQRGTILTEKLRCTEASIKTLHPVSVDMFKEKFASLFLSPEGQKEAERLHPVFAEIFVAHGLIKK